MPTPPAKEIISELYSSSNVNDFINRIPENLREDFKQELFLIICQKPEDDIISLYEKKQIYFYVARIMCNMLHSNTSPFYKQYRKKLEKYIPPDSYDNERLEQMTIQAIKSLHWYSAEILKLYSEQGSSRKVQAVTGISHKWVMKTVNEARKELKKIIRND